MHRLAPLLSAAVLVAFPVVGWSGPEAAGIIRDGRGHQATSAPLTDQSTLVLRPGERLRLRAPVVAGRGLRWSTDAGCRLSDPRATRPTLRCREAGVHVLLARSVRGAVSVTVVVVEPAQRRGTGRLAYVAVDPDGGDQEVWTVRADGTDRRRLTDNGAEDFAPTWSPDGRWIAFTSNRAGNNDLFVMRASGQDQRAVTSDPASEGGASSWSPDGRRIAFTSQRTGNREVNTISPDGRRERNLSRNPGEDRHPSWSPDGSVLSFHSQREGDADPSGYDVYVMNADGSRQRDVSQSADAGDGEAAWQPSVPALSYVSYRRPDGFDDVFRVSGRGGAPQNLTGTPDRSELEPAWSPDGRWLSYDVTSDYEKFDLYVSRPDGSASRLLVAGGYDSAWQPC